MKGKYTTNKKAGWTLCLLLTFAGGMAAMAQELLLKSEYSYRRYTTQEGLPTNMIENIFQDSYGFIWLATECGAVRFDGIHFERFLNHSIQKIEENPQGEIVIYGYTQVHILNPKTKEIRRTFIDNLLNYSVYQSPCLPTGFALCEIRRTDSLVLFRLENNKLVRHFEHKLLNELAEYQSIFYDQKEKIYYVPSADNKLYLLNEQGIQLKIFPNVSVCRFLKRGNELLGIGYEGVYLISEQSVKLLFKMQQPITRDNYFFCTLSPDGEIFARDDKSIFRLTESGKRDIILDKIISSRALFFDREGNFWHTSRQGVYNFFHLDFKTFVVNENKADIVNGILPTKEGAIFFSTEKNLLLKYENDKFVNVRYPKTPASTSFSYNPLQVGKTLYFPTFNDILKYKNGQFSWLKLPPEIYYTASCTIDDKSFAMGGWTSLKILNNEGKMQRKIPFDILGKTSIYVCQTDSAGRLWIGGYLGLSCIDGNDTLKFLSDSLGNVNALTKDAKGKLWFVRGNSICYVSGDTVQTFMQFDNSDFINLLATKSGLLVATSYSELFIIEPQTKKVLRYGYNNGYSIGEPQWLTLKEDVQGNVWLATQGPKVARFNPETIFCRQNIVNMYITSVESSINNVNWTAITELQRLNYRNRNLKFSFTGICFSNPNAVRYRYRLLGFQDEWSEPISENQVGFNNLPQGNYEFQIYALCENESSKTPIVNSYFTLTPAFWQTAWFLAFCVAVLILLTAGVALYVQRRRNRALLEKLRAEKELNELRISSIRLKAIPHFNANVLAAIEYYIANRTKEEAMHLLGIYSDFTFKTLSEVDKAARPLSEELAYVKMYLDLEKIRFLDKFDFSVEVEDDVDKSVQLPNMILHTYCENAVKHGLMPLKSGGRLVIRASQHEQIVCVSVEDNGVGRARAADNPQLHSAKQGLSILNRQIEIYNRFNHDKIVQQIDDLAKGTRFTVEVPAEFMYIN